MTESGDISKRGSSGRKKLKKRKIASDDEESTPVEIKKDNLADDQADFEEDKDDLEDNEKDDLINKNMSIEELEAKMRAIEAKIQNKSKGKPGAKKRD